MRIRRAEPKEASEIRDVTLQAYQPWAAILGRKPLPMLADYSAAFKNHRFDVIDGADGIIALIQTQARSDSLWIENIAVSPASQGQAYGGALLEYAHKLARDSGLKRITLYTNKLMAQNIAIYQRYGFVVDFEDIMEHATVVHMSKNL